MRFRGIFKVGFLGLLLLVTACGREESRNRFEPSNPSDTTVTGTGDVGPSPAQVSAQGGNSYLGLWGGIPDFTTEQEGLSITFKVRIGLESDRITNFVECQYSDGTSLKVQVSAPAQISGQKLQVKKSAKRVAARAGHTCRAEITQKDVDLNYSAATDSVTFADDTGNSFTLSRRSE